MVKVGVAVGEHRFASSGYLRKTVFFYRNLRNTVFFHNLRKTICFYCNLRKTVFFYRNLRKMVFFYRDSPVRIRAAALF